MTVDGDAAPLAAVAGVPPVGGAASVVVSDGAASLAAIGVAASLVGVGAAAPGGVASLAATAGAPLAALALFPVESASAGVLAVATLDDDAAGGVVPANRSSKPSRYAAKPAPARTMTLRTAMMDFFMVDAAPVDAAVKIGVARTD